MLAATLAGCVAREAPPARVATRPAPALPAPRPVQGLESVIGRDVRALIALFGAPGLDIREGPARKLQFLGPACVLDLYLYPQRGGDPVVTHVDARHTDGRDMDKAACVEALRR